MSSEPDRHTRRRLSTRRVISTVATRLFAERGFDHVTIDEIAAAADVGRMTVFNHFARKEDLFFDRDEESRTTIREAIRDRPPGATPLEALRLLAHGLVASRSPFVSFTPEGRRFVETVAASPALVARARAIRDELAIVVAEALAGEAGSETTPEIRLTAALVCATWAVALVEAHRLYRDAGDARRAAAHFLALVDRGSAAQAGSTGARRARAERPEKNTDPR